MRGGHCSHGQAVATHGSGTGGRLDILALSRGVDRDGNAAPGVGRPRLTDNDPLPRRPPSLLPRTETPRGPQALAAHGSDDWFWVAQARPDRREPGFFGGAEVGPEAPGLHTSIHARPASGAPWIELPPVGERVVSLGNRGSQLAVLLESGQWELLSQPDIAATGQALPVAGARLLAFSNTQSDLWALASVPGGIAAINAAGASAEPPVSRPAAGSPSTVPATAASAISATRPTTSSASPRRRAGQRPPPMPRAKARR